MKNLLYNLTKSLKLQLTLLFLFVLIPLSSLSAFSLYNQKHTENLAKTLQEHSNFVASTVPPELTLQPPLISLTLYQNKQIDIPTAKQQLIHHQAAFDTSLSQYQNSLTESEQTKLTDLSTIADRAFSQAKIALANTDTFDQHYRSFLMSFTESETLLNPLVTQHTDAKDAALPTLLTSFDHNTTYLISLLTVTWTAKSIWKLVGDEPLHVQKLLSKLSNTPEPPSETANAIRSFDSTLQQNSSLIEETAAAAQSTASQATELSQLLQKITL